MKLDDIQREKARLLATVGGFSHKYIAAVLYNKPFGKVTELQHKRVTAFLSYNKISVMQWRNGATFQAQAFANNVLKPSKVNKAIPKKKYKKVG